MFPVNEDAWNIFAMVVTDETFHFEMFPLKGDERNKFDMSVIVLVSAASTAAQAGELPPTHELIKVRSSDAVTAPTVGHKTSVATRERMNKKPGRMVEYLAYAVVFPSRIFAP